MSVGKGIERAGDNVKIDQTLCMTGHSLGGIYVLTRKIEYPEDKVLSNNNIKVVYEVSVRHNALIPQRDGQIINFMSEEDFQLWKRQHGVEES